MQAVIKQATVQHLKMVKRIDETLFGTDSYPLFALRQLLDISGGLFKVAFFDEDIVGYAIGHYDAASGDAWFLSLGVLPQNGGKGIGQQLTSSLLKDVEEKGAKCCYLTANPGNLHAIRLYERLGFVPDRLEENYYGDGISRIIMVRTFGKV